MMSGTVVTSGGDESESDARRKIRKRIPIELTLADDVLRWTLLYPFECAQTLMMLGYEPVPPRRETFCGKQRLALPNILSYMWYMVRCEGFESCYKGLPATLLYKFVYGATNDYLNFDPANPSCCNKKGEHLWLLQLNCGEKPAALDILNSVTWRMLCTSISTIVSHPFYVVATRMIAQFVGKEARYGSIISSIKAVFQEDGPLGFFKGLVPRLIAGNLKLVIPATVFLMLTRIRRNRSLMRTSVALTKFFTDRYTHQLDVVAATMTIENSNMLIGNSPFITRRFSSWFDLWNYLTALNIENRGRSPFYRYYSGPTTIFDGKIRPATVYFGSCRKR